MIKKQEVFIGPVRPPRPTRQPDEILLTSLSPQFPTNHPTSPQPTSRQPSRQHFAPGLVFDDKPVNVNVVTAATFRPPTKNPDVFDVVVTANQNFGNGHNDAKPSSNYPGKKELLLLP